jgi:pimeloyl-ACP methyl ester carboxylesterase
MSEPMPVLLVPGLLCSARLYSDQLPVLWSFGPVTVANHTRDDSMGAIARRILAAAPPRFALAGLSMGGYVCLEIMRQAPERVAKLALMDTTARPDTPEQSDRRRALIEIARGGKFAEVTDRLWPLLVHRNRRNDARLLSIMRQMTEETGIEAFVRQQTAIIHRVDSRPTLASIRCPTLVLVGDGDELIPPDRSQEIANGIAGSKYVVVTESGHMSTMEQPEQVNRALVEWMQLQTSVAWS